MRLRWTTALLITVALSLGLYQFMHRWKRSATGLTTVLSRPYPYPESFGILGDDRQVVVQVDDQQRLKINETPLSRDSIGPELRKIFEYRSLKIVWFIADQKLTYGEAVRAMATLHSQAGGFRIVLLTLSQSSPQLRDKNGIPVEFCPMTLSN